MEDLMTWGRSKAWKELKLEENPFAQKEKKWNNKEKKQIKKKRTQGKNKWGKNKTKKEKARKGAHEKEQEKKANKKELGGGTPPHLISHMRHKMVVKS